ncbi:MAG: hypothetical protein JWR69_4617 [Pedosphaera sp.]|nr:hypothetical protein [Pedosphaera sp.]
MREFSHSLSLEPTRRSLSGRLYLHAVMNTRHWSALCLIAILAFAGCERAPSKSQVVGTYSGTLNGASETLVLRADDTFSQEVTLPSHQKITATGTWRLQYKAVDLDKYMLFYDEGEKNGALVEPKEIYGMRYVWGADMLIRDWDTGYYTLKHR